MKAVGECNLRIALLQLKVGKDRLLNIENAASYIKKANDCGAKLITLPECFNSPYGVKFFKKYAEPVPNGLTCNMLAKAAKDNSVHIVGGTIPEIDQNRIYNTCTVWNPSGELIAKYRKIHLYDVDIPGGMTFKESDILSSGNELATFKMNGKTMGIAICYDLRFEELAKIYRTKGCEMLIYPGAFNMKSGPMHWELLQRGRALDNQVFVLAISPARGQKGYIAWGHSQVTDPWGKALAKAGHEQEMLICDIDFAECNKVRSQLPIYHQRRTDIYNTVLVKK